MPFPSYSFHLLMFSRVCRAANGLLCRWDCKAVEFVDQVIALRSLSRAIFEGIQRLPG